MIISLEQLRKYEKGLKKVMCVNSDEENRV